MNAFANSNLQRFLHSDSTKSRDRFRNKMECSRRKAFELIDLINEQTTYNITEEMFDSAYFPWNETSESKSPNLRIALLTVLIFV